MPDDTSTHSRSQQLRSRAECLLVGGVNSPVRSFAAVGCKPILMKHAEGAWITDVDDNRYVDLMGSWGTAIVGHAHPQVIRAVQQAADRGLSFGATCEAEIELAELIFSALPSCEMIRFVSSGTEAVMSAARLARAATGRSKLLKFDGCYHGHADALLVRAGSGAAAIPASSGLPAEVAGSTLIAPYNDAGAVQSIMNEHGNGIAAILVEPIAGNMGLIPPLDGFLQMLRSLCDKHGSLLIYDEVMSGFRVAWGGWQCMAQCASAQPDITCLGKVIGGGMPVAAYAASRELMHLVAPLGPMYQAGTLSGNPVAMAAGLATLRLCEQPGFYEELGNRGESLMRGLAAKATSAGCAIHVRAHGGMLGLFFSHADSEQAAPQNFDQVKAGNHEAFAQFFRAMLTRGVLLPPSPFEALFLSAAHSTNEIDHILSAAEGAFQEMAG